MSTSEEPAALIVEDEPELLDIYSMWISQLGHAHVVCRNGLLAYLEARGTRKFSLVITDLPEADREIDFRR